MNGQTISASQTQLQFNIPSTLALGSAGLLLVASAATNLFSAIGRQPDLAGKAIAGSVAVAVSVLVALSLPAAIAAFGRREWIAGALASLAFCIAATFSVSAALGTLGGPRLQASISVEHTEGERKRLAVERAKINAELGMTSPARNMLELSPEIARILALPGINGCARIDGPITRQWCPTLVSLQTEHARAEKLAALSGTLARIDADISRLGSPKIANPDALAVATVLSVVGITVSVETINVLLTVAGVLVLEIGAGMSLAVANALRSPAMPIRATIDIIPTNLVEVVPAFPAKRKAVSSKVAVAGARQKAENAIVDLVKRDGAAPSSVRKLSVLVGGSRGTVHSAVIGLVAAGAIVKAGEVLRAA